MTQDKKPTKREHWLPETSHLQQFTNEQGVVQVYRFKPEHKRQFLAKANHFPSSPNGIGFENDLYEAAHLPTNAVEDYLARLEGRFGTILEEKIKQQKDLTEEERQVVALYVDALQHRTPRQRDHWNSFLDELERKAMQISLAHNAPHGADKISAEIAEARKRTLTDGLVISQDVNLWRALDFCFLVVNDKIFRDMEFITSDHPVSLLDFTRSNSFYGLHPWHKTAESVVPLTPKIALFGNTRGITGYKLIDANYIREINSRTLAGSQHMVIARAPIDERESKAIVERFPQSLLLNFIRKPRGRFDKEIEKIKKAEKKQKAQG